MQHLAKIILTVAAVRRAGRRRKESPCLMAGKEPYMEKR
jgi:hypothetical protein